MCTRLPCTHLINDLVILHVFVLLLADEVSRLRTRGAEPPPPLPTASHGPPVHRCGRDASSPDVNQARPGATAVCGRSGRRSHSDIASRRPARGSPARVVAGAATYAEGRHSDATRTASLSHGRSESLTDSRPASRQRRRVYGGRAYDLAIEESDGPDQYSAPLTSAPPPPSQPPTSEAAQALPPGPCSAPLTLTPLPPSPPPASEAAQALPGTSTPRVGAVHVDPPGPQSLIPISLDGALSAAQFLEGPDIDWASTLKAGDQRRLCDCVGCISHSKDIIRRRDNPRDSRPQVPGVRYVHPPGLGLRQASRSEIAELST